MRTDTMFGNDSICISCRNMYSDDCGYCCRYEGDSELPEEAYNDRAVKECKFFSQDY